MILQNSSSVFLYTLMYVMNQSAIREDGAYNYYYTDMDKGMVLMFSYYLHYKK